MAPGPKAAQLVLGASAALLSASSPPTALGPNPFNQSSLRGRDGLQSRWERGQHSPHPPSFPPRRPTKRHSLPAKHWNADSQRWEPVHQGLQQFPKCLIAGASLYQSQAKEESETVAVIRPHKARGLTFILKSWTFLGTQKSFISQKDGSVLFNVPALQNKKLATLPVPKFKIKKSTHQ